MMIVERALLAAVLQTNNLHMRAARTTLCIACVQ
jgi:hypothetical protein